MRGVCRCGVARHGATAGHNAIGVWDVEEEEVAVVDFSAEAAALERPRTSAITAVAWDADRSSLMCA